MLDSKRFWATLESATSEVETMAVWRSLSLEDRQKAMRLLLGKNWKRLYKGVIEEYGHSLDRI